MYKFKCCKSESRSSCWIRSICLVPECLQVISMTVIVDCQNTKKYKGWCMRKWVSARYWFAGLGAAWNGGKVKPDDSVAIFGLGTIGECCRYKFILDKLCKASSMLISDKKSIFLHHGMDEHDIGILQNQFHFVFKPIEDSTKYLGYALKPNNYSAKDLCWLIKRFEVHISHWTLK